MRFIRIRDRLKLIMSTSSAATTAPLLKCLRDMMGSHKIDAYVVVSSDSHNSEYTAPVDKRREYISRFTGSAATVVVTQSKALLWTDGRYFLQAANQLDSNWTLMKSGLAETPTVEDYLVDSLQGENSVGTDSRLMSSSFWLSLEKKLVAKKIHLKHIEENLVDCVWRQFDKKEEMSKSDIYCLDVKYAGVSWVEKVLSLKEQLIKKGADFLFLSSLDEIAWLFNLRGSDISYNPVFKAYCLVENDKTNNKIKVNLFVNCGEETVKKLEEYLKNDEICVTLKSYHSVYDEFDKLVENKKVWIDSNCNAFFYNKVKNNNVYEMNPVTLNKAVKNSTEIECIKSATLADCAALINYFGWLEHSLKKGEKLTETSAADMLEKFRSQVDNFKGLSFNTISSCGANGSIIHYDPYGSDKPTEIDINKMYLCDSGAQYLGCTTDITRTLHFGTPTEKEKITFTLVLKGHINFAKLKFPERVKGHSLDVAARAPLWSYGLEYLHGTGHGVGAFLNVHEGPQNINYKGMADHELLEGMLCTNEPGYYEDGEYGIRIENMILVQKAENLKYSFKNIKFCEFYTVSLVPICQNLIVKELLSEDEKNWLNDYHKMCLEKVEPYLKKYNFEFGLDYLKRETQPL